MSDIFLSYASEDRDRVQPFVQALRSRGWSVWWDPTIPPGKTWDDVIAAALDEARCVVVFWSKHSVDKHWVLTEAHEGRERGILVPALIDVVRPPLAFRRIQAANLVGWGDGSRGGEFEIFVGAIADLLGAGESDIAPPPVAGTVRVNPKDGLPYVWIPPGKFLMGCSPGDTECWDAERPAHEVDIAKGFWLGQTPVTVGAWKRYVAANGKTMPPEPVFDGRDLNKNWKDDEQPIVKVTWDEAAAYCAWAGGRLPTEAEWEYAARAGSTGVRYGELDQIAWYGDNSGQSRLDTASLWKNDSKNYGKKLSENGNGPKRVGLKDANAWGLYDMLGNVWEWVEGDYNLRGGSWYINPRNVRASERYRYEPGNGYSSIGFRCGGELSL